MSLLVLENLKKHFGTQEVLKGASLAIDSGSKVGIVGRNGGGKTTLFRMITGEEHPDWGEVRLRKKARLGFVAQRPVFEAGLSVREHVDQGLAEAKQLLARVEAVGVKMGAADGVELERLMREHDLLTARVEELGGWETERTVATVLSGIGLARSLWEREARTLSGGEQNRVAMARALVGGHDLLLLDEPTNHLDLEGIEWLERYLKEHRGAVLIISHDRRLLENSVERILELEFGRLESYPGNYSRFLAIKQERYQDARRRYEQQRDFVRKEEGFIKKHMGSQRTAEAKGRLKKLRHIERLERPHHDVRRPAIRPPEAARGGEKVLETEGLIGGYGERVLFEEVELRIGRGQRIGIVGPNGAGKSTLLRILAGRQEPLAGRVQRGHAALCGFHDQDTTRLREDGTVRTELLRRHPSLTDRELRGHLARFLFRGEDIEKEVPALSGGERARLCLAILVLEKTSWLALDEPTNHLDLASRTALEEMLSEYQGALLAISHDREFLDGLCNHVIEVGQGVVREHRGNYSSWRQAREEELVAAGQERARLAAEEKKAARAAAAQAPPRKRGGGGRIRNRYKFEKLEARIIALEEELEGLNASLATAEVYTDSAKLRDVQYRIAEVERELEVANEEWANWE